MRQYQRLLEKYGFPGRDEYDIPDSSLTFPDGAHYRMEVSGIDSLQEMEALANEKVKRNVPVHRVICMSAGTHLLSFQELRDLSQIGHDGHIELIVIPGPRANFDIGSHAHSDWGKYSGIRVRGTDNILFLLQDIMRCIEAGIKGFLLYGEDVLFLFHKMRLSGDLPKDLVFKLSYTSGVSNPVGAKLVQDLGADSINPVTDLTLPMLSGLRKVTTVSMDIVVASFENLGSFNRFWETPEIVRVSSPCYLKQELQPSVENAKTKVKYCEIIREIIEMSRPNLKFSEQNATDLRISKG